MLIYYLKKVNFVIKVFLKCSYLLGNNNEKYKLIISKTVKVKVD